MNQHFYDNFSTSYDLWTSSDTYLLELINFYSQYFSSLSHTHSLVELGIGTGNIGLEVLKNSTHSLIGIDNSKKMLIRCSAKIESKKLTLIEADISSYQLEKKASYVYLPYRTLCHFISLKQKRQLLETVYSNLEVGGTFLFDCDNPNLHRMKMIHNQPQLVYTKDDISIYQLNKFDFDTQVVKVSVINANSKNETVDVHTYDFSWIKPEQINILLEEVGFELTNIYGDTKMNPLRKESLRQIYEVKKV